MTFAKVFLYTSQLGPVISLQKQPEHEYDWLQHQIKVKFEISVHKTRLVRFFLWTRMDVYYIIKTLFA